MIPTESNNTASKPKTLPVRVVAVTPESPSPPELRRIAAEEKAESNDNEPKKRDGE